MLERNLGRLARFTVSLLAVTLIVNPVFLKQSAHGLKLSSPNSVAFLSESTTVSNTTIVDGGHTVSITGKIRIKDGTPVENATISFAVSDDLSSWKTVYTDSNGYYKVDLVPGS